MAKKIKDEDQPWIDNYPPLRDFLRALDARCDWQVALPMYGGAYAEQWRAPGSMPFIVTVLGNKAGWDIYTSEGASNNIAATLDDVRARIYPSGEPTLTVQVKRKRTSTSQPTQKIVPETMAETVARPKVCPVCQDGACETKSERCGKGDK